MSERMIWNDYNQIHRENPDPYSSAKAEFICRNSQALKEYGQSVQPRIGIVIPAHNEQDFLPRALASVNRALELYGQDETCVLVVDNESNDVTSDIANEFGASVIYEGNKGLASARNAGLESLDASVEYVLTTDADTVVPAEWIANHIEQLSSGRDIVFTYGDAKLSSDSDQGMLHNLGLNLYSGVVTASHRLKNKMGISIAGGYNNGFLRELAVNIGGYSNLVSSVAVEADLMERMSRFGTTLRLPNTYVITSARRVDGRGILVHAVRKCYDNAEFLYYRLTSIDAPRHDFEDIR